MTSFDPLRQCFAKRIAKDKLPGLNRALGAGWILLILSVAAFQLFVRGAAALPVVTFAGQYASRFGPHSSPEWLPVGDKVLVSAVVDSIDPIGSPTILVEAIQSSMTVALVDAKPDNPYREYDAFIDFDPGLTGFWEIIPTDSTGTGPSIFTNPILEPEFVPLVDNLSVRGTPSGVKVTWTMPNLNGFDIDAAAVRFYEAASGEYVWDSQLLPVQTTSFQVPAGVLQAGVDYVPVILLGDFEGSYVENASWTFSEPFRFTSLAASGDFNLDGNVDAADYVAWCKGLGTVYSQTHYAIWRSHFGQTAGSGAALPSAQSLSAAVPEPATLVLLIIAACVRNNRCRDVVFSSKLISA